MNISLTIDGITCACEPGEFILDIAVRNGVSIPALCHHDGLPGQGCCRVCVVEVETDGRRSIVTACNYPVERKCSIYTNSERVVRNRNTVLSLLRASAPESNEIARYCDKYGVPPNPRFEVRRGEKCIMCGLCARACQSLGTSAIATMRRGVEKTVATPYGEPSAVCVGCASCARVCPSGAIELHEEGFRRTIWGKSFPLRACKNCGERFATSVEMRRAAARMAADVADSTEATEGAADTPAPAKMAEASADIPTLSKIEAETPASAAISEASADIPALCEKCRKKAVADVLAKTYAI